MSNSANSRLLGKVALVTGGGDGIGRAVALQLAKQGAAVIVIGRTEARLRETIQAIETVGAGALAVVCDVREEAEVDAALQQIKAVFGRLDIAVNNAGVDERASAAADQSTEEFRRVLDTNVLGVFLCTKYEVPLMLEHQGGSIINISSGAGVFGVQGQSAYVASKHAVIGYSKSVALDYVSEGIRVNVVAPGMTETDMMLKRATGGKPENIAKAVSGAPIGRFAKPDEIANAVSWLASEDASYMIGSVVVVDGGQTID
jgi:NAD(P)-dependent dehydrogenase (short-subunit alcohol dehydrogenase family)